MRPSSCSMSARISVQAAAVPRFDGSLVATLHFDNAAADAGSACRVLDCNDERKGNAEAAAKLPKKTVINITFVNIRMVATTLRA